MGTCWRRVQKEMQAACSEPIPGVSLLSGPVSLPEHQCVEIMMKIKGAESTLYAGEEFQLRFRLSERYPFEAPEVIFMAPHIPIHPHIYSNGHICLSILDSEWTAALTTQSVCLSLISMLSSCKRKVKPDGDGAYVERMGGRSPKLTSWNFHDDDV